MFVGLAVLAESRLDFACGSRSRAVALLVEFSCHLVAVLGDLSRAGLCRKFGASRGFILAAIWDEAHVRATVRECLGVG